MSANSKQRDTASILKSVNLMNALQKKYSKENHTLASIFANVRRHVYKTEKWLF